MTVTFKQFSSYVLLIFVVTGALTLKVKITDDNFTFYSNRYIAAQDYWYVEYWRTYGEDEWVRLSRKPTLIDVFSNETKTHYQIYKKTPYYASRKISSGGTSGTLYNTWEFSKAPESIEDFPSSYNVRFDPNLKLTVKPRDYRLIWKIDKIEKEGLETGYLKDVSNILWEFNLKLKVDESLIDTVYYDADKDRLIITFLPNNLDLDINIFDPMLKSTPCYQETANVSTDCGGLDTGTYSIGGIWMDGNKSTGDILPEYRSVNWSVMEGTSSSSLWEVTYEVGGTIPPTYQTSNITLGTCWNDVILQFRIHCWYDGGAKTDKVDMECYDGSSWIIKLSSAGTSNRDFAEDAMWWIAANPEISFVDPTPADNNVTSNDYAYVNVSLTGSFDTTSFIDFDNSLVAWWRFNNASDLLDHSSNSNDCTDHSTNYDSSGKFGGSRWFGGDFEYLECGSDTSLNLGTNDFTAESWFKNPGIGNDAQVIIIDDVSGGWGLWVAGKNPNITEAGYLKFYTGNSTNDKYVTAPQQYNDSQWHHVVGVRDGINLRLYVDSILMASDTQDPIMNITASGNISIGNYLAYSTDYFYGNIDEVKIHNRALGYEEINASYNSSKYNLYHNFTDVADGIYTYIGHTQDTNGNLNNTETRTVTINTSYPNVTVTSPTDSTYSSTSISLDVYANKPISEWWYSLNDGSNTTFTPNITITGVYGSNNITVWGKDYLNQEDSTQEITLPNTKLSQLIYDYEHYFPNSATIYAENFTLSKDTLIDQVSIKAFRSATPTAHAHVNASIQESIGGLPSGIKLAEGTLEYDDIPDSRHGVRYVFLDNSITLSKDKEYFICVVSNNSQLANNTDYKSKHSSLNDYTGGLAIQSTDGGTSWHLLRGSNSQDLVFEISNNQTNGPLFFTIEVKNVTVYLNSSSSDRYYEQGSYTNLTAIYVCNNEVNVDDIWLDIDAPGYGVNYTTSATGYLEYDFLTFCELDEFNDSTTTKTITSNSSVYFEINNQDEVSSAKINITSNSIETKNIHIDIGNDGHIDHELIGNITNGVAIIDFLNDSSTIKNLTYADTKKHIEYIEIPKNTTITAAQFELKGYNTTIEVGNYTGDFFYYGAEKSYVGYIAYNNTHFFIADHTTDTVDVYDVDGVYIQSHSLDARNTVPLDITWDGTYFWVVQFADTEIHKYDSSWNYAGNMTLVAGNDNPHGVAAGTYIGTNYIWVVDYTDKMIYMYLNGLNINNISISGMSGPTAIEYVNDEYWISEYYNDKIFNYNIGGTYQSNFSVSNEGTDARGVASDGEYLYVTNSVNTYKYEMINNPENVNIDIGYDLIIEQTITDLNATKVLISNTTSFQEYIDSCTTVTCDVPIYISSETQGIIEIQNITVNYTFNPIYLNDTAFNLTGSGYKDVELELTADTWGNVTLDGLNVTYSGSKNITVTAHNADYSYNDTQTIRVVWSEFSFDWTTYVENWYFIPYKEGTLTIEPYNQRSTRSITNITSHAYIHPMNISIKITDINLTKYNLSVNTEHNTSTDTILTGSYIEIFTDLALSATQELFWWLEGTFDYPADWTRFNISVSSKCSECV